MQLCFLLLACGGAVDLKSALASRHYVVNGDSHSLLQSRASIDDGETVAVEDAEDTPNPLGKEKTILIEVQHKTRTSLAQLVDISWKKASAHPMHRESKAKHASGVDVFLGTGGHVHTYPGATTPWGMVIATPWAHSSRLSTWDTQSGFNSDVDKLDFFGMAHTALSGAGSGELGELRLLPLDDIQQDASTIFTDSCSGSPGYFKARVGSSDKPSILIESSVTKRAAIHKFSFDTRSSTQGFQVALSQAKGSFWGYGLKDHKLKVISDHELEGCSLSQVTGIGQANSLLCFVITSDVPFDPKLSQGNLDADVLFKFARTAARVVIRVGVSRMDIPHARFNLEHELGRRSLDAVVEDARRLWEESLSVAQVALEPVSRARIFYTGLYHTMLAPHLLSEADGTYRLQRKHPGEATDSAMVGDVMSLSEIDTKLPIRHMQKGYNMYTTFSFWDTYRAEHPLLNLIHPAQSRDFGLSLVNLADAWGFLPRFQLIQSPADMMEGDGGSVILATMAREGIADAEIAFQVLNQTRRTRIDERETIMNQGVLDARVEHSVSKSLEQAKADQCTSLVANDLRFFSEADYFKNRANFAFKYWDRMQHVFAPLNLATDSLQATQFEQVSTLTDQTAAYQEGTALQYSFGAEFDIETMIATHGGPQQFIKHLDYFFDKAPAAKGQPDLTGNHHGLTLGDEPSMHTPYLYSYVGELTKTSDLVDNLVKHMFKERTNGLPGNDDLGAMSAWLVFSMLGFYPVFPCSGEFALGRPFVSRASLSVPGGSLEIHVHNQGDDERHIHRATWNGKDLDLLQPILAWTEISKGGLLEMWMVA